MTYNTTNGNNPSTKKLYQKLRYGLIKRHFYYLTSSVRVLPNFFVIDGKCAIMGSANFTENSFHNFVEYILITKEIDMVNGIERDFESFWLSCDSFKNQITTINVRKILRNLKKKVS